MLNTSMFTLILVFVFLLNAESRPLLAVDIKGTLCTSGSGKLNATALRPGTVDFLGMVAEVYHVGLTVHDDSRKEAKWVRKHLMEHGIDIPQLPKMLVSQRNDRITMFLSSERVTPEQNTVFIPAYNGGKDDELVWVSSFLLEIARVKDVRTILNSHGKWKHIFHRLYTYKQIPLPDIRRKTLVLDMDHTLIESSLSAKNREGSEDFGAFTTFDLTIAERPGLVRFLREAGTMYEVVLFTAGRHYYADRAIEVFDREHVIKYRYYRKDCYGDNALKNLEILGRNLDGVLLIDDLVSNMYFQPDNGILISAWHGEASDRSLRHLLRVLKYLEDVPSIPEVIKKMKKINGEEFLTLSTFYKHLHKEKKHERRYKNFL